MIRLSLVAAISCALAAPLDAVAQAPRDPIPHDVVMAILRHVEGPGQPAIIVTDRLPADLATRLSLPPGARITAMLMDGRTRVIGTVQGVPDSVRLWFDAEFVRRGYSPLGSQLSAAFRAPGPGNPGRGFCAERRLHTVSARSRPEGTTEFVLTIRPAAECDPAASHAVMGPGTSTARGGMFLLPPDLPLLHHPRGADDSRECQVAAQRAGNRMQESTVSTTASAEQLLDHYAAQLVRDGWTRQPWGAALGSWARRDSTGREILVTLSVESGPGAPDCRRLRMISQEAGR